MASNAGIGTSARQEKAGTPSEQETGDEKGKAGALPRARAGRDSAGPELSPAILLLPVEVDLAIPVPGFRLRNLVQLEAGQIVETEWPHDQDLPLAAGEVQLAWSEFDATETTLAIRLTRLA